MQKGFIAWIVLIIIGLAALKFFMNWDIFDAAASEQGISTIGYIRNVINYVWGYLETPVILIWTKVLWPLLELFWQTLQAFIEWGKNNASTPIAPIR